MNRPWAHFCIVLVIASLSTAVSIAAVRIGGAKYKRKDHAVLRTEEARPDTDCAVIVRYDRSTTVCLDEAKQHNARTKEVGGTFCRKLALLPGTHTIQAKILEYDQTVASGTVVPWSHSPTSEARSITFDFDPGQTYQLHVSVSGDLQIRCRYDQARVFKWRTCP